MKSPTRTGIRRPLVLHAIVAIYVLAPLGNLVLLHLLGNIPFPQIIRLIARGYGAVAALWLLTAPLVGIGLYLTNRVTWFAFLTHGAVILADYMVKWILRPQYYLRTLGSVYQALMLVGNLALVVALVYVTRRNFRAPYFQRARRGWRARERVPIHHRVTVDGREYRATDISSGGCFIAGPQTDLVAGRVVSVAFHSQRLDFECSALVVRQDGQGCGLQFLSLGPAVRADIRTKIVKRSAARRPCEVPCTLKVDGFERFGVVRDMSERGCFVQANPAGVREGMTARLAVDADPRRTIRFHVMWVNAEDTAQKPQGFGGKFLRLESPAAIAGRDLEGP